MGNVRPAGVSFLYGAGESSAMLTPRVISISKGTSRGPPLPPRAGPASWAVRSRFWGTTLEWGVQRPHFSRDRNQCFNRLKPGRGITSTVNLGCWWEDAPTFESLSGCPVAGRSETLAFTSQSGTSASRSGRQLGFSRGGPVRTPRHRGGPAKAAKVLGNVARRRWAGAGGPRDPAKSRKLFPGPETYADLIWKTILRK